MPPLPRGHAPQLFIVGCAAGCLGVVLAFILGLTLVVLAALELPPFDPKLPRGVPPIPAEFVGVWRALDDPRSTITIRPDGKGDCDIHHRGSNYQLTGARVRYDKAHQSLSLKFSILGPSWHVDAPPHPTTNGVEMQLDGRVYRKTKSATQPPPGETWTWAPLRVRRSAAANLSQLAESERAPSTVKPTSIECRTAPDRNNWLVCFRL